MSKYYLLTFNRGYADEHNVPALACMNEKEYKEWLETPSGKLNPNYQKELDAKAEYEVKNKAFWQMLTDKGYTLNGSANTSRIPKTDIETLRLEKEYIALKNPRSYPKKVNSHLNAWLGNGGEYFNEDFSNYYLMKEFVEANLVKVTEVDEPFKNYFDKAGLSSLSLCNIFDIKDLTDGDYYDDEDIDDE